MEPGRVRIPRFERRTTTLLRARSPRSTRAPPPPSGRPCPPSGSTRPAARALRPHRAVPHASHTQSPSSASGVTRRVHTHGGLGCDGHRQQLGNASPRFRYPPSSPRSWVASLIIAQLGLYRSKISSVRARELSRLIWLGLTIALLPAAVIALASQKLPWMALAVGAALSFFLLVVTRSGFDAWLRDRRSKGEFCRNLAIVGTNREALSLYHLFADHPELGYRIVGFIGPRSPYPTPGGRALSR